MKKTISIIAIALCLVFCVPSSPCFAYDVEDVYARTYESVQGYWDDPDYQHWQDVLTSLRTSFTNYDTIVSIVASYRNLSGYSPSYDEYTNISIFLNESRTAVNFYFWSDIEYTFIEYFGTIASDSVNATNFVTCFSRKPLSDYAFGSVSFSNPTVFSTSSWNINGGSSEGALWHVDTKGTLLYASCDVFCWNDYTELGFSGNPASYGNMYSHREQLTNFMPPDLPYVNGDGVIVDPNAPEVESNSNHMYFKGCEIGFCEPYNQNNFSNYGGAYVYIRYQVDDWIVNHISEYSLEIQLLKVVGSNQETFSKSVLLDRDGCVEIPLSDFTRDGTVVPNSGFDVAVVNSIVEDNYYKSYLYCVQGDLSNFVSKNSGVDVTSHTYNNPWGSLKDGVLSSIYFYQVTTETYNLMDNQALQAAIAARQTYNPYIFRVQVNLVSGEDRSGDVATKFDLVTGDQSDVSTSGFVNPDPFIPDTSDPNYLPSVPGDNSTTPSTIVYTGGTFSGYFNGAIGFDPGYRELKQDIDSDPNGNFTQYLAPFKNNEVGGFVGDFLDDMPTALKTIFIGGFGVLTLLGIYRFIRRG